MWSYDAPKMAPNKELHEGDHALPREISSGEASSIMEALAAPAAPSKGGKRGNIGSLKVSARDENGSHQQCASLTGILPFVMMQLYHS